MNVLIIDNELYLRLGFFFCVFLAMACWETIAPRRALTAPKAERWTSNLGMTIINSITLRLLLPFQAVGSAALADKYHWGILPALQLPQWIAAGLTVLTLDFVIYAQHLWFHRVPLLWRLHKVHHSDLDIDVTTGTRFHPLEMLLSMAIKMTVVVVIGAPPAAVVIFEILLNATAMFSHGNVRIGAGLDAALRSVIVTPDMHRVHHSLLPAEFNSNFGFNLSLWDRLLRTYRAQPEAGHGGMTIGLRQFRDRGQVTLYRMFMMPFGK